MAIDIYQPPPESQRPPEELGELERGISSNIKLLISQAESARDGEARKLRSWLAPMLPGAQQPKGEVSLPFNGPGGKCDIQAGIVYDNRQEVYRFVRLPAAVLPDRLLEHAGFEVYDAEIQLYPSTARPEVLLQTYYTREGTSTVSHQLGLTPSQKKGYLHEAGTVLDRLVEATQGA